MAIQFIHSMHHDTLVVETSGFDENLEQVEQYGMDIIALCQGTGATRLLCDERNLEYRLNTFDTYTAAAYIAQNAPRIVKIAIVCNPAGMTDGKFWETVAVNRGLMVRMFLDLSDAKAWLQPD